MRKHTSFDPWRIHCDFNTEQTKLEHATKSLGKNVQRHLGLCFVVVLNFGTIQLFGWQKMDVFAYCCGHPCPEVTDVMETGAKHKYHIRVSIYT